ncbi:hypothetical protein EDD37DRAFT_206456 [Exophiala viscosa]|uniref:uncharacterized protein n=1 Tax=Exophiala viscosa TaxID=2486360 RepID=UPI00219F02AA|nr:hypothetical protein EDD37DRAFT_206456 [Exophiala viscosa]
MVLSGKTDYGHRPSTFSYSSVMVRMQNLPRPLQRFSVAVLQPTLGDRTLSVFLWWSLPPRIHFSHASLLFGGLLQCFGSCQPPRCCKHCSPALSMLPTHADVYTMKLPLVRNIDPRLVPMGVVRLLLGLLFAHHLSSTSMGLRNSMEEFSCTAPTRMYDRSINLQDQIIPRYTFLASYCHTHVDPLRLVHVVGSLHSFFRVYVDHR